MGVYVKGVTVEKLMKVLICSTEFMPEDFEVVEVPTPHGRLIEAREPERWCRYLADQLHQRAYFEAALEIEKAPTVIEEEDE